MNSGHQGDSPPLVGEDSERTFILKRYASVNGGSVVGGDGYTGNGVGDWTNSKSTGRRSAYFVDSSSEASGAAVAQPSPLPQRGFERRTISANAAAGTTASPSRTGELRLLAGIRNSPQVNTNYGVPRQPRNNAALDNGRKDGGSSSKRRSRATEDGEDNAVFYGGIRFPASRIALWNRRPTGSPVVMTPESSAPLLVLRQRGVELIASKLSNIGHYQHGGPTELRWHGIIASVGEILQGRAADDPRAASSSSQTALEILGPDMETSLSHSEGGLDGVSRGGGDRQRSRRLGGSEVKDRPVVAVEGVLLMEDADDDGMGADAGPGVTKSTSVETYKALMNAYVRGTSSAKSISPGLFTPLRLHCTIQDNGEPGCSSGTMDRRGTLQPHHRHNQNANEFGGCDGDRRGRARQVTLSLRAEMIVPALGVKLTPIGPLAVLHTALYQSLLTRGGENVLRSGLLTLNEGRRAVFLSDTDPLSLRAPLVGVWVAGACGGGSSPGGHGPPPSPVRHPHAYAACLRLLLQREATAREKDSGTESGTAAVFLLLHLPGGISGGAPTCFEVSPVANDGTRMPGRGGSRRPTGFRVTDVAGAFEQLDFSANVDVAVEGSGGGGAEETVNEGRGRSARGEARHGGDKGSRALVIGRLRRVSNPVYAEPFRRAQEARRPVEERRFVQPESPPFEGAPTPKKPIDETRMGGSNRWHIRHQAPRESSPSEPEDQRSSSPVSPESPRQYAPPPAAPPRKPSTNASSSPRGGTVASTNFETAAYTIPSAYQTPSSHGVHGSASPTSQKLVPDVCMADERQPSSPIQCRDSGGRHASLERTQRDDWSQVPATQTNEANGSQARSMDLRGDHASQLHLQQPDFSREPSESHYLEEKAQEEDMNRYGDGLTDGDHTVANRRFDHDGNINRGEAAGSQEVLSPNHQREKLPSVASSSVQTKPSDTLMPVASTPPNVAQTLTEHATSSPQANSTPLGAALSTQGLDLRSLDPAAREVLLSQQRQLSALQEQLRRLQAELREAPARASLDRPLTYAPVVAVGASPAGVPPSRTIGVDSAPMMRSVEVSPPGRDSVEFSEPEAKPEEVTAQEHEAHPRPPAPAVMVDSTTNTSFMWRNPGDGQLDAITLSTGCRTSAERASDAAEKALTAVHSISTSTPAVPPQPQMMSSPTPRHNEESKQQQDQQQLINESGEKHTVGQTSPRAARSAQVGTGPSNRFDQDAHANVISGSEDSGSEADESLTLRIPEGADDGREHSQASRGDTRAERAKRHRLKGTISPPEPSEDGVSNVESKLSSDVENASTSGKMGKPRAVKKRSAGMIVDPKPGEAAIGPVVDLPRRRRSHVLRSPLHEYGSCDAAASADDDSRDPVDIEAILSKPLPYARRRPTASLLPAPKLLVVPRIEFGELTDDELVSDLDEGETIGLIESKYLRNGTVGRGSSSRR